MEPVQNESPVGLIVEKICGEGKKTSSLKLVGRSVWAGVKKFFLKEYNKKIAKELIGERVSFIKDEAIYSLCYGGGSRWDPFSDSSVWAAYSFSKDWPEDVSVYPEYLYIEKDGRIRGLEEVKNLAEKGSSKIAIPVAIPSPFTLCGFTLFTRTHFAAILIDKQSKTLEFYDPQGIDPAERKIVGESLMQKLGKIKENCFAEEKEVQIKYTKIAHQEDRHNCGIHTCYFFNERFKHNSLEEFMRQPPSPIEQFRRELAKEIASAKDPLEELERLRNNEFRTIFC